MSDKESDEDMGCECEPLDECQSDGQSPHSPSSLRTKGMKRRKQVLDEDLYVDQIERIIERDFFPDLAKLRQQMEFTSNASDERFVAQRAPELPTESPATFETPIRPNEEMEDMNRVNDNSSECDDNQNSKSLGLDQFLNKYTSEDNASFEQIQEQEMRRHRLKYEWLYRDVTKQNNRVKQLLQLPSIERQTIEGQTSDGSVVTWKYSNQNSVMYNPLGMPLTDEQKLANTKREVVVHSNTRFKALPFNERVNQMTIALAAQLNARQKEGKIGIDGKELVTKETPQINGFKFVASTPTPVPDLCSESPFMTWGEIESTPFSLSASDTPLHPGLTPGASHFKIPDLPQREKLGLSLATKAAKQHRDRKKHAIRTVQSSLSTPSPTFQSSKTPFERLNSMSPAAQRLATSKLGLHRNVDHSLMASYSPARSGRLSTPGSTPKSVLSESPITPKHASNESIASKRDILAKVDFRQKTKRRKAEEFF